jgi:hypothetical protein
MNFTSTAIGTSNLYKLILLCNLKSNYHYTVSSATPYIFMKYEQSLILRELFLSIKLFRIYCVIFALVEWHIQERINNPFLHISGQEFKLLLHYS